MLVYADNAATTKISKSALDAMMPIFEEYYGNPSSLHTIGQEAAEKLLDGERVYRMEALTEDQTEPAATEFTLPDGTSYL